MQKLNIRTALIPAIFLSGAIASSASAAVLTVTVGDDDCFGLGIACPTYIAPPTPGASDNSTAADPAGMDTFDFLGTVSYAFNLALGATNVVDSAKISAKVWGLDLSADPTAPFADAFEGARFQFNGNDVGTYFSEATLDGQGPGRIETVMFDIAPGAIVTNGVNTITIIPETDFLQFQLADAFAVDFVSLQVDYSTIVTPPPPTVPLPAGLPLLLSGLGLLGWKARRRIQPST